MKMMSVVVKDIFVANNLGDFATLNDWSIYIGTQPKDPSNVVTITDTGGFTPNSFHDVAVNPIENQAIQIRVRGTDKAEAYDKIRQLGRFLLRLRFFEDSNVKVLQFIQQSDYLDMGMTQDSDIKYFDYSVNINIPNQKKD